MERNYNDFEKGQVEKLIRCPMCWKDIPRAFGRCSCGTYIDGENGIDKDTWMKPEWLEHHYRFLRRSMGAIFDKHLEISMEKYYNEYYKGNTYKQIHDWNICQCKMPNEPKT